MYFLQIWRLGSPRTRCSHGCALGRTLFLLHNQLFLPVSSYDGMSEGWDGDPIWVDPENILKNENHFMDHRPFTSMLQLTSLYPAVLCFQAQHFIRGASELHFGLFIHGHCALSNLLELLLTFPQNVALWQRPALGQAEWVPYGFTVFDIHDCYFSEVAPLSDFSGGSDGKESAYDAGHLGLMPGSERSPGEGNGNPLQYSCLENPMDRGAW